MALRLDPSARVVKLVLPRGVSMRSAEAFVAEHEEWIQDRLAELPPLIPFADGVRIPVFGQDRVLKIIQNPTLKRTSITMEGNEIFVHTNKEDPSSRIVRFLKNLARDELTILAKEKAARIDKDIQSIQIRDTKTRWGSCSEDGKISFSWRLILAPYVVMDYVVAHEVAHRIHMDHSKAFWSVCAELSDDYLEGRYWMRNHSQELLRYGA